MTPEVATSVLESYRRHGPKFTSDSSRAMLRSWLSARGVDEDRYGNFKLSDAERYHFSKTKLHHQERLSSGWMSRTSPSLIDAAALIVRKAAEALGDEALVSKLGGLKAKRAEVRKERRDKSQQERIDNEAHEHAVKIASSESPEQYVAWFDDPESQPEFGARYIDLKRQARAALERGVTLSDQGVMSAAEPPIAPLLDDVTAAWIEGQGGVEYSIVMKHARNHNETAAVHIGRSDPSGFGVAVDPLSHHVDWGEMQVTAKGDGYMSGWISRTERGPSAGMFMIIAHEKQKGAGGRILDIWCRMMDAYGIEQWTAEAVGPEGRAFIDAKIRAGRLELVRERGSSLLVRCVDPRQGRLGL